MTYAKQFYVYQGEFRAEAKRLGVYDSDVPAGPWLRMIREYFDADIPVAEAAAWYALQLGPSVARLLRAADHTPASAGAYIERMRTSSRLDDLGLIVEWMAASRPVEDAVAWANLGYLPSEAAPLIAQDVTPEMAGVISDAAVAVDGGPEGHLRAQVLRLAEDIPGLLIDPDFADRLGLDEPDGH
ncbi:hypothetical protein Drose_05920 [Dactylosporangium roseum]|uniref:Uncharacterized protein n=1 Tax=Dactylosporangium roseum TaxID=47989 RepID=A0ABY5Z6Y3_9ACTN|nr:hypothetical protein [Dactylosporangium roseum]UWZ37808.1 hypothetical protein Drose_05920 [Dactylosporangium roseum]